MVVYISCVSMLIFQFLALFPVDNFSKLIIKILFAVDDVFICLIHYHINILFNIIQYILMVFEFTYIVT